MLLSFAPAGNGNVLRGEGGTGSRGQAVHLEIDGPDDVTDMVFTALRASGFTGRCERGGAHSSWLSTQVYVENILVMLILYVLAVQFLVVISESYFFLAL